MAAALSGTTTSPWASIRSATARQLRRLTSGRGLSQCRSYSLLRLMRWMKGMSSKPAVATYSTSAPRRCSTVLVATVVPCTMRSIAAPGTAALSSTLSSAPSGASGVDGALATRTDPSAPSATRSVNVPPVSMPSASGPTDDSCTPLMPDSSLTSLAVHTRRSSSLQQGRRPSPRNATQGEVVACERRVNAVPWVVRILRAWGMV